MLARRLSFQCFLLCASAITLGDVASLRTTTPSTSSFHQVRGAYIMLITFSSLAPKYRIQRLLDPTTSYSCLSNKPKKPCPPHPSKPCSAMLLLLAAQPLLSMHARLLYTLRLFSLDWAITIFIIIVVDDKIIIYNVDYIRRRMEGLGYPAPTLCSIRVT